MFRTAALQGIPTHPQRSVTECRFLPQDPASEVERRLSCLMPTSFELCTYIDGAGQGRLQPWRGGSADGCVGPRSSGNMSSSHCQLHQARDRSENRECSKCTNTQATRGMCSDRPSRLGAFPARASSTPWRMQPKHLNRHPVVSSSSSLPIFTQCSRAPPLWRLWRSARSPPWRRCRVLAARCTLR